MRKYFISLKTIIWNRFSNNIEGTQTGLFGSWGMLRWKIKIVHLHNDLQIVYIKLEIYRNCINICKKCTSTLLIWVMIKTSWEMWSETYKWNSRNTFIQLLWEGVTSIALTVTYLLYNIFFAQILLKVLSTDTIRNKKHLNNWLLSNNQL